MDTERQKANVALPTPDEIKRIEPIIREELAKAEVWYAQIEAPASGGIKALAQIPTEKQRVIRDALFAHGIVIVAIRAGEWGFAVRR